MNIDYLYNIGKKKILVYGDLMIDYYIDGTVSRISPEAPVPVLKVTGEKSGMGGAGNVIDNLLALGALIKVMGCIGVDDGGKWIVEKLSAMGVDTSYLRQLDKIKTIRKTRIISKNQQYIRLDEEEIQNISEDIRQEYQEKAEDILEGIDAVIISDYGKGNIVPEVAQKLIELCHLKKIPCIIDPKGTDYQKYRGATVCTPNMQELALAVGRTLTTEEDIKEAAEELRRNCQFQYLVLTRSEKGMMLFEDGNVNTLFPTRAKEVIDVTGAGDTVAAMLTLAFCVGYDIKEACILANLAASIVCSKFGAAHLSLDELLDTLSLGGFLKSSSVLEAIGFVEKEKRKGKKIVFTNGCFDLLHAGHLSSFEQARKKGDVLVVAVNSDSSIKRIKGDKRPIITQKDRIAMVSALRCVDHVVLMEDDTPEYIISQLHPDIVVKGKDWENKYIPERELIESYGGKLCFAEMEGSLSTTNIVNRILENQ